MTKRVGFLSALLAVAACVAASSAIAEAPGASAERPRFGRSATVGESLQPTIGTDLEHAGCAAGILGRQSPLLRYDDSGKPDKPRAACGAR